MPMNLARTELGVRPCVAYIYADPALARRQAHVSRSMSAYGGGDVPAIEDVLIPRLDAREVAAVFTAPFEAFLAQRGPASSSGEGEGEGDEEPWYSGQWIDWYSGQWRMHNFYVPSSDQPVAWAEAPATTMTMNRFRVFGMTARILVDAARVAFAREPEFEHNSHFGDEDMIGMLVKQGRLGDKEPRRTEVVVGDGEGAEGQDEEDQAKI
jgi:hypothetical protein